MTWYIGAALTVSGSLLINFGVNLIKYAHNMAAKHQQAMWGRDGILEDVPWVLHHIRMWQTGLAMFACGNLFNFVAFGFAAQSLAAALGSVQFVSNVFFAAFLHGNEVTRRILLGTAVIVCGNTLVVIFASHDSQTYRVPQLVGLFLRTSFVTYTACVLAFVGVIHVAEAILQKKPHTSRVVKLKMFAFASKSAMIGSFSVLLAKSCSELSRRTVAGDNQFRYLVTYVIFGVWACLTWYWIHQMNVALKRFSALYIVPALQVNWTFFSILGGGIYFNEFQRLGGPQLLFFSLGVIMIGYGVSLLASHDNVKDGTMDQQHVLVHGEDHTLREKTFIAVSPILSPADPGQRFLKADEDFAPRVRPRMVTMTEVYGDDVLEDTTRDLLHEHVPIRKTSRARTPLSVTLATPMVDVGIGPLRRKGSDMDIVV